MRLVSLRALLDPRVHGPKAARLAAAARAGFRVPDGWVLAAPDVSRCAAALRAPGWPPAPLREALAQAVAALGPGPYILRTSAVDEDQRGAVAAGLYHSEAHLRTLADVLRAARRCIEAARGEPLDAYRRLRGGRRPEAPVALLLQRQVAAQWAGVLLSRTADPRFRLAECAPGPTDAVTAGTARTLRCLWRAGDPPGTFPPGGSSEAAERAEAAAAWAEATLGGPADLEWAVDGQGRFVVLQLRPAPAPPGDGPDAAPPAADQCWWEGAWWQQDREHNPDPLSPLHADLIARLCRALTLPFRMQVIGGRLYTTPVRAEATRGPSPGAEIARCLQDPVRWWHREVLPALRARLEALERAVETAQPLSACLDAFTRFYDAYAGRVGPVLGEALRRCAEEAPPEAKAPLSVPVPLAEAVGALAGVARSAPTDLTQWLSAGQMPPEALPAAAAYRAAFAAWIRRVGGLFPVWDIAVPPLEETPEALHRAVARALRSAAGSLPVPDESARTASAPPGEAAPSAPGERCAYLRALREEDDLLFGRALAGLRRAVLRRCGPALPEPERSRLFACDWETLLGIEGDPARAATLRDRCARTHPTGPAPPRSRRRPYATASWEPRLRGVAVGRGTVSGRARVAQTLADLTTLAPTLTQEDILVCPTLLPGSVPFLVGVGGVVTDHGGTLSHAALLAAELGIPAVLGTGDATARIAPGASLVLHLDTGQVVW